MIGGAYKYFSYTNDEFPKKFLLIGSDYAKYCIKENVITTLRKLLKLYSIKTYIHLFILLCLVIYADEYIIILSTYYFTLEPPTFCIYLY